jgi:hypothetical protein
LLQAVTSSTRQTTKAISRLSTKPFELLSALAVCVLLICSAFFLASVPLQVAYSFSLGAVDALTARDFYPAETTEAGEGFRWTSGDSTLLLPSQGRGAHTLRLTMQAPPQVHGNIPVTIAVNDWTVQMMVQPGQLRQYAFSVPANYMRLTDNVVRIKSPTVLVQSGGETRSVGVAVFEAEWERLSPPTWLVPMQVLVIVIAVGGFYLLLLIAGVPPLSRLLGVVLFLSILITMRHSDSRFIYRWQAILMTLALCILILGLLVALWQRRATYIRAPVREWVALHWPAFVGYVVVTGIFMYPIVSRFTTHIVSFPGDAYEHLWKMAWFEDALTQQHVSPTYAPQIFYPNGFEFALSEITPAHTLLGAPITWLFGPIVSYNTVCIASYLLAGFFTYLLAHRLGARRGAAWIAGILFAFSIRHYYHHNAGHLNLVGIQWIPLALYGWEGVLTRHRTWDGYVSGLGIALAAWASWYYGPILALLLACYTLVRLSPRNLPGLVQHWRPILLAGVVTIVLVLPLAQPYIELRQQGIASKHPIIELQVHSAKLVEYFLPNPFNVFWGAWAKRFHRQDGSEVWVAVGYSLIALALIGIRRVRQQRAIVRALLVIILINVVLSLGPYWTLPNGVNVPLPVRIIYEYVPVLNGMRTWSRMVLYVVLCAALLAALGLTTLPRRWYSIGCSAAAIIVLFEYASALMLSQPGPRAVDVWLQAQPGNGAVIQLPNGFGGTNTYYTLHTGKPVNIGFGTFRPPFYEEGLETLERFPDISALRLMQRWETDYIIVDDAAMSQRMPNWEEKLRAQPLVTEVYHGEGYSVYRLER